MLLHGILVCRSDISLWPKTIDYNRQFYCFVLLSLLAVSCNTLADGL